MSLCSALHGLSSHFSTPSAFHIHPDVTSLLQNQVVCAHCLWQSHPCALPEATAPEATAPEALASPSPSECCDVCLPSW